MKEKRLQQRRRSRSAGFASAQCNVCGLAFRPVDQLAMALHVIVEHPAQFAASESGRRILHEVQSGLFSLGLKLAESLKKSAP